MSSDPLEGIYDRENEAPAEAWEDRLDALRAAILAELGGVLDESRSAGGSNAQATKDLLYKLAALRSSIAEIPDGVAGEAFARRLRTLDESARDWSLMLAGANGQAAENARALFADAGHWAVHFSNVRMGMSTFLLGLAWGVVALNWDAYDPDLRLAAWGVWAIAGLFLAYFTRQTARYSAIQKKSKFLLPTANYTPDSPLPRTATRLGLWLPVLVFVLATALFGWMTWVWGRGATQGGHDAAVSIKVGSEKLEFRSVDPGALRNEIHALEGVIDSLERRLDDLEKSGPSKDGEI